MKRYYHVLIAGLALLASFPTAAFGQQTAETWTLSASESGNKTYIARESISLKPGFRYTASSGNAFNGYIDQRLLFPPTNNTYAREDGTITTNPAEGAVVGSIPGAIDVSPSGAATYAVPIECPAGINGMQPAISLVYNSQAGNGIAGWGWNLGGLSMISRVSKNYYYDDERSGIIWDKTSPLALDGQRLIKINEWGTDSIEYRTESGLDKIVGYAIRSWGPLIFKIYTQDGKILEYGEQTSIASYFPIQTTASSNAQTCTSMKHSGWALTKIKDSNNNFVEFIYTLNQTYTSSTNTYTYKNNSISSIIYGNHTGTTKETVAKIQFQYIERSTSLTTYVDGLSMVNDKILEKILIQDSSGSTIETYQLSYDTENNNYYLNDIKESNANSEFFRPLKFEWFPTEYNYEYTDQLTFNKTLTITSSEQVDKSFMPYSYGDIDGDGLVDILVRTTLKKGDPKHYWIMYRNNGSNTFQFQYEESWDKDNENTFLFLDIDNDGKDELYVGRVKKEGSGSNISYWYYLNCYKYVNNSFQAYPAGDMKIATSLTIYNKRGSLYALSGDFLGKGTAQFIIFSSNNTPEFYYGFDLAPNQFPFSGNAHSKIFLTDINGNGKPEIAYVKDNTTVFYEYQEHGKVQYGGYQGFGSILATDLFKYTDYIQTGDFNGDGNIDLLVKNKYSPGRWKIWTSTGTGFIETDMSSSISWHDVAYDKVSVVDVNRDGKSDILVESYNFVNGAANSATLKILISNGDSFVSQVLNTQATLTSGSYLLASNFKSVHGQDVYITFDVMAGGPQIITLSKNIWFNKIKKITDSFDNSLTISYKENKKPYLASQKKSESETGNNIVNNFLPSLEVVNTITGTNVNNSYTYFNPRVHRQYRGFLGFDSIRVTDNINSLVTETKNKLNSTYYFLYPYKTVFKTTGGTLISETTQSYTLTSPGTKRYFLRLDSQTENNALRKTTATTTYSNYDTDRNPQTVKTDYGNGISTTQALTYVKKASLFNNKVSSRQVTQKASGQSDVVRKEYFFYDDKGNLTQQTKDSTDVNKVQTFYGDYDKYGNPKKITTRTTVNGTTLTRSQSLTYSSSGRFVKTKTNDQLNETVTYNYNESKGLLNNQIDRLGTTTYQYDNWGRLTLTTYPDGIKSAQALQWAGNKSGKPTNAKYYSYSESSGAPPVIVWYDALGRKLRTESYGLNKKTIWTDTEYNSKGQVETVWEPYFSNETRTNKTTYKYDKYGRDSVIVTPMGTTTYVYSDTTVTVTTPTGTVQTKTNAAGWTLSQKTNGKTVNFTHYASGQVKTATPEGGAAVSMEYDLQGNRTRLIDPDAGAVRSAYNGFGELLWTKEKVHATGDSITTSYDYMASGLLNYKLRSTEKTQYRYDSKNRISSISIAGRHAQGFTYDSYDRIIQTNDTAQGSTVFVRKMEYDALGRIRKEIYPSGYYATNEYETYGYLKKVTDSNNNLIWEAKESNARGQLTKTKSGSKETAFKFDSRGFPASIYTPGITNQTYAFNTKGTLQQRVDSIFGYKETFSYDGMNRLTESSLWTYSNGIVVDFKSIYYNSSGTMDYNGNVSSMKYGENNKPKHALTSFTTSSTAFNNPQTIRYTDFKKVNYISEGGNTLTIYYGVDEQRGITTLTRPSEATLTKYYLGNYEEERKSGNTRKIHYLCGGNGLAAVYVQNGSNDTLYYAHTDYLGSLIALSLPNGTVVERYAYDPWGNRRNPNNLTQADTRTKFILDRGYTMHEHLTEFRLINMNGRVYDPITAQFLSVDPYIQAPGNWLNYNRYTYCLNNPLKYTDPTGEIVWFVPVIIGAVIGTYMGGTIANEGQYNPAKWDWSSGKTWGYMAGGAVVGGLAGWAGGAIAGSGIPMANTAAIAGSSLINSVGTWAYTGGQTPISISLGVASYDFTNNKLGYLGKKGNKWYENLGYGLGALANLADVNQLINSTPATLYTDDSDFISHSAIVDNNGDPLMSFGPNDYKTPSTKLGYATYFRKSTSDFHYNPTLPVDITVNKYAIDIVRGLGKILPFQGVTTNCVNMASLSLWLNGIPNIGLHPYLLYATTWAYSTGIRPDLFSYYLTNPYKR